MNPSIDLIIGPMRAGKTTELIRLLNIYAEMNLKTLYVNSSMDTRSTDDFSTHNPSINKIGKIDSKKTENLFDVNFERYDVIGIDEAQFFDGLQNYVLNFVEQKNKKIIIAGLNGDYLRNPFGEINSLIPYCDSITKLYPFCRTCSENGKFTKALFTKRISKESGTIEINAIYIPVCRNCY